MVKKQRTYFVTPYQKIEVGQVALVAADEDAGYTYFTTEVLSYDSNTGWFETKNSQYFPAN